MVSKSGRTCSPAELMERTELVLHAALRGCRADGSDRFLESLAMTEVVFALLPKVILLDVAGPAEAFRIANRLVPGSYTLRFVGSTRTVDSAVGLRSPRFGRCRSGCPRAPPSS